MSRQRTIVGLGEALLCERPDASEPAGLGAVVAVRAARLGHTGVLLSRVGQDPAGRELIALLAATGVDVRHVQTDPDLPTGRIIVRRDDVAIARHLEEHSAYDNLQWDYDLEDLAQRADAVVHGLLTRRSGQTRSEENRFLSAAGAALRVFDLTNRGPGPIERGHAIDGLTGAEAAVLDAAALDAVRPGDRAASRRDAVAALLREHGLAFAITFEDGAAGEMAEVHTAEAVADVVIAQVRGARAVFVTGVVHGVLRGDDAVSTVPCAARIAAHACAHPDDGVPEDIQRAPS